jgi:hypothetical protein
MTSVLYGAGLNYQMGNPVRQEIVAVKREVDSLRKQMELLTEENLVYRKHIMKLLQKDASSSQGNQREPGGGTVQGAGFRR